LDSFSSRRIDRTGSLLQTGQVPVRSRAFERLSGGPVSHRGQIGTDLTPGNARALFYAHNGPVRLSGRGFELLKLAELAGLEFYCIWRTLHDAFNYERLEFER